MHCLRVTNPVCTVLYIHRVHQVLSLYGLYKLAVPRSTCSQSTGQPGSQALNGGLCSSTCMHACRHAYQLPDLSTKSASTDQIQLSGQGYLSVSVLTRLIIPPPRTSLSSAAAAVIPVLLDTTYSVLRMNLRGHQVPNLLIPSRSSSSREVSW